MIKPRKTLENITPYKTDKYKTDWNYKLDSNENIYGCHSEIINSIKNFDFREISLYPCYGKLIDKLSDEYNFKEDNFLVTNGCDEALNILISSYLDYNDEIISYNPSFSMPILYAKAIGADIKLVDYNEKFVFNKNDIKNNISPKTKMVYLASPNNPTGEVINPKDILELIKEFKDVLFILDLTYINFSYSFEFNDYTDLIRNYNNIAIVKSFSKDFALAGLRLGFILSDKEIILNLKKVSSPYNVNIIGASILLEALNHKEYFKNIKELNKTALDKLYFGLRELGFEPYNSDGNFILCDFKSYSDFYYEKLRKNGVIVRKFDKNSSLNSFLRITVPTLEGVNYILDLLKKKDLLIFDLDGVVFDVTESYMNAIKETFKHFSGFEVSLNEIQEVKSLNGMNCDWDTTKYLLKKHGFEVSLNDIIDVFQNLFYNPEIKKEDYLIDKERLIVSKEIFEELSKKYDLVIFSGRERFEADYSLKKFDIEKYFYYFVTSDILPKDMHKPHPEGVLKIKKHCPYKSIKYFGDSVDDIMAGNKASVVTIGVVSPGNDYNLAQNNFKRTGAKYILKDITKIKDFLEEISYEYK